MKSFPYQYIPLFNFFLGLGIWFLDALVDMHLFDDEYVDEDEESLVDALFFAEGTELWMRALVVIVLVAVGFYSKKIIHRQKLIEDELLKHKNNLEEMISERVSEINEKNTDLEPQAGRKRAGTSCYNRSININLQSS